MALSSLATLSQDLAKRLGGYASGTTDAGAIGTSDLIDTSGDSPFSPSDTSNRLRNAWALVTSGSSNNDLRAIGTYNAGTGFASQRAFSASIISGITYELYTVLPPSYFGMAEGLDYCINSTLRALEDWRMIPLSMIPDGDMAATGVADWGSLNGGQRAKVQASYGSITASYSVWSGRQTLSVSASGINQGVQTGVRIPIDDASTYILDFVARAQNGQTLGFVVNNGSDVAYADTRGTIPFEVFTQYNVEFSPPDGLAQSDRTARIIFTGYAGIQGGGFVDHVQLCRLDQERYALPPWVVNKAQIAEVFKMEHRGEPADRLRFVPVYKWDAIINPQGGSPMTLIVGPQVGGLLDDVGKNLWINARAPADTLAQRSDVTSVDSDLILAGAAARAYEHLARQANGDDRKRYQQMQKNAMIEFYRRRKSVQNKPSWKIQETSGWTAVW